MTLIVLGVLDSGTTITMHVGDVLALPGLLPGEDPDTAQPARSSDPAVLGPLGIPEQGPFAEFRAWQPGRATLDHPSRDLAGARDRAGPALIPGSQLRGGKSAAIQDLDHPRTARRQDVATAPD